MTRRLGRDGPPRASCSSSPAFVFQRGAKRVSTITTNDGTEIYYKDWGSGPVVTFSHGWPLSADA
jgi:non-heme chloroperoxidase